ncbi:D-glycero-beta-D-manno-heptose-1,7-bisphosphate 7-phosphatase [Serratia symbiotica]|nr:D-glycero-beta-D-manno-heptose-1,7-bisphosphate 7-phosphatase [Serratia symbiotica]
MAQSLPAVFLDRDGTINVDYGYVYKIKDFQFINGVLDACQKLKSMGFLLVVITNQSGIAHGKFSEEQFIYLANWMLCSFSNRSVNIDRIYVCPHHPEALIAQYRQTCDCRKPKPGMLLQALHEMSIDMSASYMVGDKPEDMQAALAAGVGTKILVKSGKPVTAQGEHLADLVLNSLADLPEGIKKGLNRCCNK